MMSTIKAEARAVLRLAFATLTDEQKRNVRKHLANGVRVLAGRDSGYYSKPGAL